MVSYNFRSLVLQYTKIGKCRTTAFGGNTTNERKGRSSSIPSSSSFSTDSMMQIVFL